MKTVLIIAVILLSVVHGYTQTTNINLGATTVQATSIYTSAQVPWELKYGSDNFLWMTTREGSVYRVDPANGAATLILDHTGPVEAQSESGMLGMVFHPDFPTTPYLFIVYTYLTGGLIKERVSRFTYAAGVLGSELIILDGGNIAGATIHNGSRLVILPDNTLLMTTGDAANQPLAQNMSSLNGKVLRMNLDGTIPADNPFPGSYVYSLGHRNAQGLMLHPNGKVYSTEHGPNNNDEFQIIEAGRNYGWPSVQGFCDNDVAGETAFCTANNVKEPLASWNPAPGGTWAPNDLIWYTSPAIPEFQNSVLVTFLKTNKLRRIQMNGAGDAITAQADFFVNQWGRLRDITSSPSGEIFLATNTSPYRIIRIRNLTSVTGYYRTRATGNWNNIATWEVSPDNVTWYSAASSPDYNANTISILNGHTVTVTANVIADQVIVSTGGVVVVNSGIIMTVK